MHRYALCSTQAEDPVFMLLILSRPEFTKPFCVPSGNAVDVSDSDRIVAAYVRKIGPLPKEFNSYPPMLFAYAINAVDLKQANFESECSQIVEATFERAWAQLLRAQEMDPQQWEEFAFGVMDIPSIFSL